VAANISIDRQALADFCRRRHVRKLSLFGSVLREDFRADSDVDVLVAFEPGHVPGFIALHDMEEELSRLLGGRAVDLVTERFLNRRIRDRVLADAEVQYARSGRLTSGVACEAWTADTPW
jgi:predicted nucleotidyltransferase